MDNLEKKTTLCLLFLKYNLRHFQTAINILFVVAIGLFFGGLITWPFYSDGWKFMLSALGIMLLYVFADAVFKSAVQRFESNYKTTLLSLGDNLWLEVLRRMRRNKAFLRKFQFEYADILLNLEDYSSDQLAKTLIGKIIQLNNTTVKITKIGQAKYYLMEIQSLPLGLDSLKFNNGCFTDESDSGQTLKQYILTNVEI